MAAAGNTIATERPDLGPIEIQEAGLNSRKGKLNRDSNFSVQGQRKHHKNSDAGHCDRGSNLRY